MNNLGIRIKAERLSKGITQEKLAEKADISLNFMSLIENGRNMSVDTLVKIAQALGVSVDYLLRDSIPIEPDSIIDQITYNLSDLTDEEKLFFLNIITQYKSIKGA